jgi:hypothetical protein
MAFKLVAATLTLVSITSSAFATPSSETPFGPRFEAMKNICLKRDYRALSHKVSKPQTEFWDYSMSETIDILGRVGMKTVQSPVMWVRDLVHLRQGLSQSEKDLATMMAELSKFAADEKLGSWERACLSKCVTTHMITYEDTDYANFLLQPARIAEKGIGVCKQYAMLGEYVSNQLGVTAYTMGDSDPGKGGHSFNKITIAGVSYYSEPQNDSCEFFSLH